MRGLVLLPRQNQREHQGDLREFKLATSEDGTNWQATASGQLASTFDEQKIIFPQVETVQYVRLTDLSGFGNDPAAALAEVAVIYAGPKLPAEPAENLEYENIRTASPDIDAGDGAATPAKKTRKK